MQRSSVKLFTLAALLVIGPPAADAQILFDSGRLSIGRWHVHLSRHAFGAESGQSGFLEVRNNTPERPIHAGYLLLNRQLISLKKFLNGPDPAWRRQVDLRRHNRLRVFLIGTPRAAISISVASDAADPLPSVAFSAEPDTIAAGSSSTLFWSSQHADACVIEPDLGSVGTAGSIAVAPSADTTYTITATGPGGTAVASTSVTVIPPPPQVTLAANPMEISLGQSTTLTWSSQWADQVSIDPGIGSVDPSGAIAVHPAADTTYTVTATGPGGSATSSVDVLVTSPISIEILSPSAGDTILRPDVMVQGTFSNATGRETGIVVNGKVAMVYGSRFVVNHVPLEEGLNTITATATDAGGNTQAAETTVSAAIPEHHITLSTNIASGSAPLEMSLGIGGTFGIQDAVVSFVGPAPDEFVQLAPDDYQATFTQKGVVFITAEAVHAGTACQDTIGIVVVDETAVDALLREKWDNMKAHLISMDVVGAVRDFDENKKGLYEEVFSALLGRLPQIAGNMQDISLISIENRSAKYRIRRVETHNTGTFEVTYYVYFIMDENGIWKIYRF